jgi:hypothetical protein
MCSDLLNSVYNQQSAIISEKLIEWRGRVNDQSEDISSKHAISTLVSLAGGLS